LLAVPSGDATRQARILALSAEAALQAGERMTATRRLDESRAAYGGDEIASVVASRLAKTPDERLAILQKAIAVADEAYRIKAELGSVLLAAGKPREALAAFDASLPFLDEAYTTLYGEQRQRAWALRDSGATMDSGISTYLTRDPIPLVGMAAVAQAESNALDRITGGASWAPGVLFERLRAAGWYVNTGALPGEAATRKDAALFLWMLMTHGDRQMAVRYTERYAAEAASPVPDVPYGSPYFDSVLGVVEEGIMTLVDGRNFDPDTAAAGLDFYGWLLAAAAWR
jgi:tetratricopeptide (TPR) repeat protein